MINLIFEFVVFGLCIPVAAAGFATILHYEVSIKYYLKQLKEYEVKYERYYE